MVSKPVKRTRPTSRRKKEPNTFVSKSTGVESTENYCRKCRETKIPSHFYPATDLYLDTNGMMSICKDCVADMYNKIYQVEFSIDKTVFKMCRILNVKYDERALDSAKTQIEKKEKTGSSYGNVFGLYKGKLTSVRRTPIASKSSDDSDYTFVEPLVAGTFSSDEEEVAPDMKEVLEERWVPGMTLADYEFLEKEFSKWKMSNKCDTQSEIVMVKAICFQQNKIRQMRIMGHSVTTEEKALMELMKVSALTPNQQNAASAGRTQETFGSWVADIERMMPAEYHEQNELYKDMDDIDAYGRMYITDPIRNFITGSRDFNLAEIEDDGGDFDNKFDD